MPKGKGSGVMDKSPGDASRNVKVPTWRGEKGDSSAKGAKETECVHYDR